MRGSALRSSGWAGLPRAPRGLARAIQPRAPRPKRALLPSGNPAPRVRPLAISAQEALLPETPARKGDAPLAIPSLAQRLAELPVWNGVSTPFPTKPRPRLRFRSFA